MRIAPAYYRFLQVKTKSHNHSITSWLKYTDTYDCDYVEFNEELLPELQVLLDVYKTTYDRDFEYPILIKEEQNEKSNS